METQCNDNWCSLAGVITVFIRGPIGLAAASMKTRASLSPQKAGNEDVSTGAHKLATVKKMSVVAKHYPQQHLCPSNELTTKSKNVQHSMSSLPSILMPATLDLSIG